MGIQKLKTKCSIASKCEEYPEQVGSFKGLESKVVVVKVAVVDDLTVQLLLVLLLGAFKGRGERSGFRNKHNAGHNTEANP